jgi:DNA-binding protein HU-beta
LNSNIEPTNGKYKQKTLKLNKLIHITKKNHTKYTDFIKVTVTFANKYFFHSKLKIMNKGDLISAVADTANLNKAQAGDAVNAVFNALAGALKGGDKVTMIGFGTFSTVAKPAREARNPATGKTVNVPAKTAVKFKAGKELNETVN